MILNENFSPENLQHLIGYSFQGPEILDAALTRRAYLNENPSKKENFMDPLATLGDAILSAVVVYKLYENGNRQMETLTVDKIRDVNRNNTRRFAENHHLQEYVHWGEGEKKNEIWRQGNKALDTAFEALIGAVFLDAQKRDYNGITIVKEMLERLNFFEPIS